MVLQACTLNFFQNLRRWRRDGPCDVMVFGVGKGSAAGTNGVVVVKWLDVILDKCVDVVTD